MRRAIKTRLVVSAETVRVLAGAQLAVVLSGEVASGSQIPSGATCPPPKNGEGSGCVTGH